MLAGRYRLIRLLGAGGMGEVYQADDLILGQPVALKFAAAARHVSDPQWLRRLRDEVSVARRISHPNVCRVYDVGESGGEVFLSTEYIDGEDLASLLRRIGRLPRDKAVQIAWELCAAVQAAHENGVLHRDLKPANVMLDGHGHVKVMDFGIAEHQGNTAGGRSLVRRCTWTERRAGVPATTATDIYALGLVLYEVFTGTRAFAEASPADRPVTTTVIPRSPSSVVEDLGPQID
jgi:serine/threonine protein kinase